MSKDGIQIISGEIALDNYEHWSVDIKTLMTVKGWRTISSRNEDQSTRKPPTPQATEKVRKENATCLSILRRHVQGKL